MSEIPDSRLPRWFALHRGMAENAALEVGGVESPKKKTILARCKRFAWQGEAKTMKRKPDILWVLVLIFGLGVVTTGYTQGLWEGSDNSSSMVPVNHSQQLQR